NGSGTNGRKNYYRVSYGRLSTRLKETPEGYSELAEEKLKSMTQDVDNLDLRNKFIKKDGDYPFQVFFETITGEILSIDRDEYDKGVTLALTINDVDNEESILQMDFYGKYSENLLNRLLNIQEVDSDIVFHPYAIPSEAELDGGKKIKYYTQGVALRENGD